MSRSAGQRFCFASMTLSPQRGLLLRDGVEVPLARKPFAVLVHLLRHRDRVVSRDELLEAIWPGVQVSEAAFASVVRDLRRALGDDGLRPRFVATVRGRGLRFQAAVREEPEAPPAEAEGGAGASWRVLGDDLEQALDALERVWESRGAAREPGGLALRERGDLLVALARARWAGGATGVARGLFLEASSLARRLGDREILAQAALGFAGRTDVTPGVRHDAVALLEEAVDVLDPDEPLLRGELLARLGTELVYEGEGTRARSLAREAVKVAESAGEPGVLAYALTARHFTSQRPESAPRDRLRWAERAIELVEKRAPSDVLALALQQRMLDLLELGEGEAFEQGFRRYSRVVEALDQPFFDWVHGLFAGSRALLAGRDDEAERLAHEALERGRRIGSPNAEGAFAAQLFALRHAQGRLAELAPLLRQVAAAEQALPAYRAALAAALAAAGADEEARVALDAALARGLADLPRDPHWLGALVALALAAARVGSEAQVRRLRDALLPCTGRLVVAGHGAAVLGPVDHALARLDAALGDEAAAAVHREAGEALRARLKSSLR